MQTALAAALARAEAAEAQVADLQARAKDIDDLRENNAALLARLASAHRNNQKLLQKPRQENEESATIRRLKKRIAALEAREPKAKRGGDADQV